MVRFEVNKVINGRTGIKNLYAIHGSNETGEPKFLIVGSQVGENNKLPVIDITSSFHDTCYYFEDTPPWMYARTLELNHKLHTI